MAKNLIGISWVAILIVVLSSCASSSKNSDRIREGAPSWAFHPESAYSETRYLTGVGVGSNRTNAIEDAKKQLAESFVVKVQSEMKSSGTSTFNQNSDGAAAGETKTEATRNLSLQTVTYLRGADVKEVAEFGGEFYALVALDKLKARSGLLLEANRLKTKLEQNLDSLDQLYTNQRMADAKSNLAQLEELYGEAAALGMAALIEVGPLQTRLNKMEQGKRVQNAKYIFAVKTVKGEDYFERDIQECINERGGVVYSLAQAPEKSHKIEISVVERPQHLPVSGWEKIRFDLTAAIVRNDGKLYRIQTTQTESGRNRNAILESVSDRLSHDFCENLFNRMSEAK